MVAPVDCLRSGQWVGRWSMVNCCSAQCSAGRTYPVDKVCDGFHPRHVCCCGTKSSWVSEIDTCNDCKDSNKNNCHQRYRAEPLCSPTAGRIYMRTVCRAKWSYSMQPKQSSPSWYRYKNRNRFWLVDGAVAGAGVWRGDRWCNRLYSQTVNQKRTKNEEAFINILAIYRLERINSQHHHWGHSVQLCIDHACESDIQSSELRSRGAKWG